eukprot:29984-Eustigmatos_ZCMA.PRE.1
MDCSQSSASTSHSAGLRAYAEYPMCTELNRHSSCAFLLGRCGRSTRVWDETQRVIREEFNRRSV